MPNKQKLIKWLEDSKWKYQMATDMKKKKTKKDEAHTKGYLAGIDLAIHFINLPN